MLRIRLLHLNLLLYGVLLVLLALYRPELEWAAHALPLHLAGEFPAQQERLLHREAVALVRENRDIDRAKDLLARSLAIDPHSRSLFFLGEVLFLHEGKLDEAFRTYNRYLEIDPSDLQTYLRMAEILKLRGQAEERRALLEQGLAHFRAYAAQYTPRHDPKVAARFNRKATAVHRQYSQAIRVLEQQLAESEPKPLPAGGGGVHE